TSAKEMQNL
ncbi:recombination endonuclease, partial [Escherichia coli EC1862]